ncbi:hypothetical protein Tco_1345398 [Tanacetum coccineum]
MATTKNFAPPGAAGRGPTILIPHCEKCQADIMDVIFGFSFLACIGPTHLNHGDKYDLRYNFSSIILYNGALMRSFLAFYGSSSRVLDIRSASYFASLLVVSNANINVYVYYFPSGLTTIIPAIELSKLEAPSVNSFHTFSCSDSFLLTSSFFASLFSRSGVSARKSANIYPLMEFLPLNSISCSPNLIAHLAMWPNFSGFAKICFMGLSLRTSSCNVRLIKYMGICFFPLSAISIALTISSKVASVLSALFERNLLRAAIFLLRFCISLTILGCRKVDTAFTLEGYALMPCFVMIWPEYTPSSTLKEHFFIKIHVDCPKPFKGYGDVGHHFFFRVAHYYHIVGVNLHISSHMVAKNFVYEPLIGGPCIFEAEG